MEPRPAPHTVKLHNAEYMTLTAALAGPSGTSQA